MSRLPRTCRGLGAVVAVVLVSATGCPGGGTNRPRPVGGLLIVCDPPDAQIFVDDRYLGSVKGLDKRPLVLRAGDHRVELRQEGYFAHYADVRVVKGVRERLEVKLRREPF